MPPDFTSFLVDILYNEWGTGDTTLPTNVAKTNVAFVDRRDTSRARQRQPDVGASVDLSAHNAIGVGAAPTTDNEATGFDFNYRYDGGADVRIRAKTTTEGGFIAGSDEWSALTGEAQRIINGHRRHPIPGPDGFGGAYTLMIDNYNDMSQNYQYQHQADFDVMFDGIDNLS